ncbi:MipA/OmpV family protein [Bosea sp. AAP35]|uniref:MipA/OmpV family protein n=1 Tax=Bosea sp. AAP35 TaxID=1523417 RepID=UPI0006B9A0F8|nr:MipA/OmpV family protein [Bosea sp. AAP35]
MRSVAFLTGLVACLLLSPADRAAAQSPEYSTLTSPQSAQNWTLTLGAGLHRQPDYLGSNDYIFRPKPIISLGRGLKSTWWSAEDDAISIGFFSGTAWRVGFSGNLLWERKASTNRALIGVPDVKFGAEAGAFVEFYPASWLRARVDLRRGIVAHDGLVAEMKLDAFARINDTWKLGIGPRMVVTSADYVRTYFGSIPGAAGTGGLLQRFNSGVLSYGAIAQATYYWSERLQTTAYVEYKHLVGDAAKSPVVRGFGSRDSITVGVSASYAFDLGF